MPLAFVMICPIIHFFVHTFDLFEAFTVVAVVCTYKNANNY